MRRAAFAMGLRFRLHRRDLPGTPDVVFPKYKVVILVHGCFWHQHEGCRRATIPKTRAEFWKKKLHGNVERDATVAALEAQGWRVEIIWECETRNAELLRRRLWSLNDAPRFGVEERRRAPATNGTKPVGYRRFSGTSSDWCCDRQPGHGREYHDRSDRGCLDSPCLGNSGSSSPTSTR